jgi:carboxyl-terminal processing protease
MKQRVVNTVLILVLALNLYVGSRHYLNSAEAAGHNDVYGQMHKFARVLEEVRKHYVDEKKVGYDALFEGALDGMLKKLDKNSAYLNAKKHETLKSDTQQQFGGIGVLISIRAEWLTVVEPMPGGPSIKAGVLAGDKIIKIGDQSTKGFRIQDAVDLLRGKPGTKVTITVRSGKDVEKVIQLERAIIKTKSVRDLYGRGDFKLLEKSIGYVRLTSFSGKTATELEAALAQMEKAGLQALIMDLRGNPGGLLHQSALVTEKFVKSGQLIVSTEGRGGHLQDKLFATAKTHRTLPMVILVNGDSASASEIVAGCLQDLKRAELVGMKTYGKGSVQTILPLQDGSAIRITTAKYYTPSHRIIHEQGIEPDHKVEMTDEQMRDLSLQRSPGGFGHLSEEDQARVKATKDLQLEKGLELLREKIKAN